MPDQGVPLRRIGSTAGPVEITVLESAGRATRTVLFAAGSGGNPLRHRPLLEQLAARGCTVVAPHFGRLPTAMPTGAELEVRRRWLIAALAECAGAGLPVCGVGHSIGAALLLGLAGGELTTFNGDRLSPALRLGLGRLALLAPPADFFRQPGALRALTIPIRIWAGGRDTVTPPAQGLYLRDALSPQAPVAIEVEAEAGHFSFMDEPPPGVPDPHPDRTGFLRALADAVGRFVVE